MRKIALLIAMSFCNAALAEVYVCSNGKQRTYSTAPCPASSNGYSYPTQDQAASAEYARRAQKEVDAMKASADEMRESRYMESRARQAASEGMAEIERRNQPVQATSPSIPTQNIVRQPQSVTVGRSPSTRESFTNDGRVLRQPPGSAFEYDNKGNAYHRPDGSAFSYGKNGKECFHYGGFADCR